MQTSQRFDPSGLIFICLIIEYYFSIVYNIGLFYPVFYEYYMKFTELIASKLQPKYEKHRAFELEGTPALSRDFFSILENRGVTSAWNFLAAKQKLIGKPNFPPQFKAIMNLTGSFILSMGVREKAGISELGMTTNPYRENYGERLSLKQQFFEILFMLTMGMLFTAQDGVLVDDSGYASEHRRAGHAQIDEIAAEGYLTPYEAAAKKAEYDRRHGW